ncbi:MAG: vWA domain-containing protein [Eubacteriales bacterium]|nr:vWA domain-containing protein [Eubacteriales bacterium]
MASNITNRITYGVDIVLCIDATGSMEPILDSVKEHALNFHRDFQAVMENKHKRVSSLRVRIVAFRDYMADGASAMMVTRFFNLPEESELLDRCIRGITPDGGGDDPEDGLEALAYAIKSDWDMESRKRRHVIVLWSDDATHELGFGKESKYYPGGMARDFAELSAWWGSPGVKGVMDESAKRLLLFTPAKEWWTTISRNWTNVIHEKSEKPGVADKNYSIILNAICNTI